MVVVKKTADKTGYPCPSCRQLFNTNPEPPPPHTKPDSEEVCLSVKEWLREIEDCP